MNSRHNSYWEVDLSSGPLASNLPKQVDILIVGAGFMGRWLAFQLGASKKQLRTLVIDRDRFSYGASSRNAGFLTCGQVSEMLEDSNTAGLDAVIHTFLQRRRGIALVRENFPDFDVLECGSTDCDELTDEKRALAVSLNDAAGEEVYAERTARFGKKSRPAMFNSADGGLHPVKLLQALENQTRGAKLAFGVEAKRVADGFAELSTATGTHELKYDRAFICTNGFAGELDASSEVIPGRGQVTVTSPLETQTDKTLGYLNAGYDYFRFIDDRLLVGGGRDQFSAEQGASELATTDEVRTYLKSVAVMIAGHDDFTVDYHWAGVMGFVGGAHLGGSPRRKLDERTEVLAGFGGMGVALTPVYAQKVAAEL